MQFLIKKSHILSLSAFFFCTFFAFSQESFIKKDVRISWYGDEFNGRPTSSGEIFDMTAFTAAHKTLPFGTLLEVTNLANGKKIAVRVNDRGPFVEDRELDVSKAAAQALDMLSDGIARASIIAIGTSMPNVPNKVTQSTTPSQSPVNPASPSTIVASGISWRIQLGSFSTEENARRLVIKLREAGFDPAFEKTDKMTRVVLSGIRDAQLAETKEKLKACGYKDYLVRQESW